MSLILYLLGLIIFLMVYCRWIAWLSDQDRKRTWHIGDKFGRFFFGKRWDYPLGKSFEKSSNKEVK